MRIVHVIESAGGSADFVLFLVEYLPQHEHIVVHGERTIGRMEQVKGKFPNLTSLHWKGANREVNIFKDFLSLLNLRSMLKELNGDVVHLHSSKAGFLGRIACALLGKKKVFYTPNGLAFMRRDVSSFRTRLYVLYEKIASKINGQVVACSRSEAEALHSVGIPATYVNNGTRILDVKQNKETPTVVKIATTGRITRQKDPALFNLIAQEFFGNPSVSFVWIGDGELKHLLTSPNIEVTGWVTHKEVISLLDPINLYLSTAGWEGLPFAVIEAMVMNKPLLLTKCVGNVDLVKTGVNGFTFETVAEAVTGIKYFLENPEHLSTFGTQSHEIAKAEFDVKKMAAGYDEIYNQS